MPHHISFPALGPAAGRRAILYLRWTCYTGRREDCFSLICLLTLSGDLVFVMGSPANVKNGI